MSRRRVWNSSICSAFCHRRWWRVVDGPRLPVAVLKTQVRDLPLDFKLDASTATNPTLRLSPSMHVVVVARISRAGQTAPQPGEPQGYSQPVPVGSHGVLIEINDAPK